MLAFFVGRAFASSVSATICAEYNVNFDDATSIISQLGDDYLSNNLQNQPARGARLQIHNNDLNSDQYVSLSWNSATACAVAVLDNIYDYDIKLWSYANVNGNWIYIRDNDTNQALSAHLGATTWTPIANPNTMVVPLDHVWNIAAAASYAMYRRNGGVTGETIQIYRETCPGLSTSCYLPGPHTIYIHDDDRDEKYTVAHELGHYLADANTGFIGYDIDGTSATGSNCTTARGGMISKEFASFAAVEGIACYYAAVAFNSSAQTDCEMAFKTDYNLSGGAEVAADDELSPSCE